MFAGKRMLKVSTVAAMLGLSGWAVAQQGRQYTAADYAQAEKFMQYNVNPLVYHGVDAPTWLADGRFWYRDNGPDGVVYTLVDPAKKTKVPAFDHAKLTAALTAAVPGRGFKAAALPISDLAFEHGDRTVMVTVDGATLRCDLSGTGTCSPVPVPKAARKPGHIQAGVRAPGRPHPTSILSPDRKKQAFIRDNNLWVVDVETGAEKQLTTDGVKDYGYATDNAGWSHSDAAVLLWSPDSKKIATFQQDQRKVREMYLVPVVNTHPDLQAWKYPLVGDPNVTMIERVVIDVEKPKVVRLKMPPDQHRSTICDDVACHGGDTTWDDVQWSEDGTHLGFVSTSRDHKQEWMRIADAVTGEVREVMGETAAKFFESGNDRVNWKYLPKSNELLWFSERDGWGQMYLYDLTTGALKNQITHGEGNVTQVLHVDEKARTLYFLAVGKEPDCDPYFSHFYSVKFDGSDLKLLTPEKAAHAITVSNDGRSFIDVYSTPTQPQTAVVRDTTGKVVMDVAKEDITKLQATGWVPLTPIKVKARDGKTDLYGFMFKPTNFDASKKYPIVNNVYPGPQTGSCGKRDFMAAHKDNQALAELGFIVVCIDGMGTPWRSKAFHEAYYADLGDNTIPDQVSGMKDLAAQYPFIDLDRAGMYGHSGGGNATAAAMFHYPDFFKVGIAESGNHDNRDYEDDWAEKWAGLLVKNPDGTSNYDSQANQKDAAKLKGHLLLAHGTMDDNVPMNNTLIVVDALIKANKDFDLLLIPNVAHGYGPATPYMTRRRWDYFVRNLAGGTPPPQYEMKPYNETQEVQGIGGPDDTEQ
ncbi:DPP IV N-terminal domain-containing protein [Granulicella sp. dw_53]|uniref:S9 family peptidase n=1 Tax=Granulicella sp. dw_53 TaxID=2719792 RepID=UPI0021033B55|nr:DPP IV N-terminal domain-containing protein [Granulicella sp. dw_53]